MTLEEARQLDVADPLRKMRERFLLPDGVIYLDGNSLGALPKATSPQMLDLIERQWREDLITSWNKHGWIEWPQRVAARLAPIVGASPSELLIADSTSVCLFKLLAAAVDARPGRRTILTQERNFPTDLYVAQGLAEMLGLGLQAVPAGEIANAINDRTAVVTLTHVDYRTGCLYDMRAINAQAREAGALTVWDLSHSAGAMELDLTGTGSDLAVGCGYKYLNGGPGAPAFLFVADRLQGEMRPPLQGWMGHSEPFAFDDHYHPAADIRRFLTGTPSILSLAAMDMGLASFDGVSMSDVAAKGRALTQLFIHALEHGCGSDLRLASPRDPQRRGSHVSFAHPNGYAVIQALIAKGVVGDFREPDLMRFGFAPMYNSYEDAWTAAAIVTDVLGSRGWDTKRFRLRQKVT